VKLKNLLELMGLRGKPKQYHYAIESFDIGLDLPVRLAQWLHPKEKPKSVTRAMVAAYRELLNEGDFCIDIGAHTGDSTLPMALAVGAAGCVLALEPNPYVFHVLEKNARLNPGLTNIITLMAAATPSNQFIEFEYSDSGFCNGGRHENISALKHGHSYKLSVFGLNLNDELKQDYAHLLEKLRFIKIDAEGYDLYVLDTLREVIESTRPIIKAEIFKNTDGDYRARMYNFFDALDYAIYRIDEEPVGHGDKALGEADMSNWKHFDILCLPK